MNATIDWNAVGVFVRVVEAGSFTKAAKLLGLPTSSISRAVARLEDSLGVRLIQRTTRRLNLTDAGRLYYDSARGVVQELESAGEKVHSLGSEPRGVVRVTAATDLALIALPEIVRDFLEAHPKIEIELTLTSRTLDLVNDGIDIAVRAGPLEDSSLIAARIVTTELGLFGSKRYFENHELPETLADLSKHACILYRAPRSTQIWKLEGPNGQERVEVNGVLRVDEMLFAQRAVAAGIGIGLLPAFHCSASSDVVHVLPFYSVPGTPLSVVTPSSRHPTAAVTLLRDFLIRRLREFQWKEAAEACARASRASELGERDK